MAGTLLSKSAEIGARRLQAMAKELGSSSSTLQKALLFRIGTLVRGRAVQIATEKGVRDNGVLVNHIVYTIEQSENLGTVTIGTMGIPYARIHEYGGPITAEMKRAMFWSMRERGLLNRKKASKGFVKAGFFPERSYLRASLSESMTSIIDMIRGAYGEAAGVFK